MDLFSNKQRPDERLSARYSDVLLGGLGLDLDLLVLDGRPPEVELGEGAEGGAAGWEARRGASDPDVEVLGRAKNGAGEKDPACLRS
jgi:hypothetical protein